MKVLFCSLLLLFGVALSSTSSLIAQGPIDITDEHAKLSRKFADRVWIVSKTGTISLPKRLKLATGKKGESIEITFPKGTTQWTFRSSVDEIVQNHSEIVNDVGGWTDEDGLVMTLITLNRFDKKQRAGCLVIYNEKTGVAVFISMSSQL
ncbi:MAG: hypothetical protein JJ958_12115 [Balneola sp.]|nr:hypothetical protein [Balneola sp.]